jgi:two-component system chemotaxis response regulator CheB
VIFVFVFLVQSMAPTRVLVVDDSSFMRTAISSMLRSNPDIEVVGTASNGREGVEQARLLRPDLITMDIEMPIMTGLEALREIMATNPTPVIMISTLTTEGAHATMEALSLGAADFIPKQTNFAQHSISEFRQELLAKITALASSHAVKARFRLPLPEKPVAPPPARIPSAPPEKRLTLQERIQRRLNNPGLPTMASKTETDKTRAGHQTSGRPRPFPSHFKVAVLGVSTGGPLALQQVIPRLPAGLPVCLLIVQHMPAHFTKSLADRLNNLSHIAVAEAHDRDVLAPGTVLIAPGGHHMVLTRDKKTIRIVDEPSSTLHKPSVDVTVASIVEQFGGHALGIIMTGMGRDGATALKTLHDNGGYVIAQNEETSIVYGMPKAVVDEGTADEIVALEELAASIASCLGTQAVAPK